jgi:acetyl-CoA carboxylase carboxyl transferase subunit beta
MSWFRRLREGITTSTHEKKEAPDGLWHKCKECGATIPVKDYKENLSICPDCNFHGRIDAREYFRILFDNNEYEELFSNLAPYDVLNFTDLKSYKDRIKDAKAKTKLDGAMTVGTGRVNGQDLVICAMNFSFIGGSMGSVMGEKISLAIDHCLEHGFPLMIVSKSGGARMMEAAYSLMQMAKTSAKLTLLAKAGLPYISFLTDPTTGGVTASFAMLGDINFAEPGALIGFAGPRVIKETIKKDLPKGFQRSEFLLEKGFLDFIVNRHELKNKLSELLGMLVN